MKKKIIFLITVLIGISACADGHRSLTVTISNPLAFQRSGEMVEMSMSTLSGKLRLADTEEMVVLDADGGQVPYQVTYDGKMVFPATVPANGTATYTIRVGDLVPVPVTACGKYYPERLDDVAWENDLVAFRTYGPALQRRGERSFGYDVFTKNNTSEPVVEARYAEELNPEKRARIAELRKSDPKAANELQRAISYHVDHGNGMDCYSVGPTLGGGTAALLQGDTIIYPYCYRTQEILDNGPLRFTLRLEFNPFTLRGDTGVVETRLISLDAGSYLNKTVVTYAHLKAALPVATGIVLHDDGPVVTDAEAGYVTYVDPTDHPDGSNGKMFMGAAFPARVKEAKTLLFSDQEKKQHGGAKGHLLAISDYQPGEAYTYYWGSAWSKGAIRTSDAWDTYMARYAQCLRAPLVVSY
ncbi:MAG: DUF4861 domain-containing protein [Mediterranea sp.]|jgi:hypothetical protein|nr:DUF4861 domain-containing protein [Mediterranea sp.]